MSTSRSDVKRNLNTKKYTGEPSLKLKVIIPVSVNDYYEFVTLLYEQYKLSDVRIDVSHLDKGPREINTRSDAAKAMPYVLDEVQKAEQAGYHGIVVTAFVTWGCAWPASG